MSFGAAFDEVDPAALRRQRDRPISHDNLFHTLLGMLDINTVIRDRQMDLTDSCRASK